MTVNQQDIENKLNTPAPDYYQEQNGVSEKGTNKQGFVSDNLEYYYNELTKGKSPIKTGFNKLDAELGGLYTGVSVLGGTSGTGKTAFSCQIAYNLVQAGAFVLFLSLEMESYEIFERIAAVHAKIKDYQIFNDTEKFINDIYPKLSTFKNMDKLSIYDFYDNENPNDIETIISIMENFIKWVKANNGEKQEILIIIDHLQVIENKQYKGNEAPFLIVNDAFRKLEKVAHDYKIKILALSQLNRNSYNTVKENGVSMQDFKGASRIEHGAVALLGLTRANNGDIRLNIAKNRYYRLYDGFILFDFNGYLYEEKKADYSTKKNKKGGDDDYFNE